MHTNDLSVSIRRGGAIQTDSAADPAMIPRAFQLLGAAICIGLAAAMPWAGFTAAGITVGSVTIPMPLLALMGLAVAAAALLAVPTLWQGVRQQTRATQLGLMVLMGVAACSIAGLEYGYRRTGGLNAYSFRPAAQTIGYALGVLLLACSMPRRTSAAVAHQLDGGKLNRRALIGLSLFVVAASALIGTLILDGMPHVIDGVTYLLQGRTYASGRLTLDRPLHPDLFKPELLAFKLGEQGYFGKYPPVWPLLLGVFDLAGLHWLAGPVLAGASVLVTHRLVCVLSGNKPLASWTAVVMACCPWLWMNAATMLSHTAALLFLLLFLLGFAYVIREGSRLGALAAGASLGLCILTRPGDALFFCLPCIAVSVYWMIRNPARWLTRLPLVALCTLPGLVVYKWLNQHLAGDLGGSMYGMSHAEAIMYNAPTSPAHALIWLQESWAGLSRHWSAGVFPIGALAAAGLIFARRELRGTGLLVACTASLLLCYVWFVFGGQAWVGPRWYVPAIPGVALCIAASLLAAAQFIKQAHPRAALAHGHLRLLASIAVVTLLVALPARLIDLRQAPPHGIDGRLVQHVKQAGLSKAVVALPVKGLVPGTTTPHYKRGIAGMWSMQTPFERSEVIYVRQTEDWQRKAAEAWPGRSLFEVGTKPGDYTLSPVQTPAKGTP